MKTLLSILAFILCVSCLKSQSITGDSGIAVLIDVAETDEQDETLFTYPVYLIGQENLPGWEMELSILTIVQNAAVTFEPNQELPAGAILDWEYLPYESDTYSSDKIDFLRFSLSNETTSSFTLQDETLLGYLVADYDEPPFIDPRSFVEMLAFEFEEPVFAGGAALVNFAFRATSRISLRENLVHLGFHQADCGDSNLLNLSLEFTPGTDSILLNDTLSSDQPIIRVYGNSSTSHAQAISLPVSNTLYNAIYISHFQFDNSTLPDELEFSTTNHGACGEPDSISAQISNVIDPQLYEYQWEDGTEGYYNPFVTPEFWNQEITVTTGSCVRSYQYQMSYITPLDLATEVAAPNLSYICGDTTFTGGSIRIDTAGDSEYPDSIHITWEDGPAGFERYDLASGVYRAIFNMAGECLGKGLFIVGDTIVESLDPSSIDFSIIPVDTAANCSVNDSVIITLTPPVMDSILLPFQINWDNGDEGLTTIRPKNSTATYVITFANGCTSTMTISTPIFNPLEFDVEAIPPACNISNGSIRILPASGYSFDWSTGQDQHYITGLSVGDYEVTITRINSGCQTVRHISFPVGEVGLQLDYFCNPEEGGQFVTAYPTNNAPSSLYTYIWSNGTEEVYVPYSTVPITEGDSLTVNAYSTDGCTGYTEINEEVPDCDLLIAGSVVFNIGHKVITPAADQVCVPVSVDTYSEDTLNIVGFQGQLNYDHSLLSFTGINLIMDVDWFIEAFESEPGDIRILSYDNTAEGVELTDSTVFELCFTPLLEEGYTLIQHDFSYTQWNVITENLQFILPIITPGSIAIGETNIWPGDANANGTVNHFDILNIGLANTLMGPERENASLSWQPQSVQAWQDFIPTTNLNAAHADTDGNGLVAHLDQIAIDTNWTRTTDWYDPELDLDVNFPIQSPFGPPLFIQPDTVQTASTAIFEVHLGTEERPAEDIYGLAFSVSFDDFVVDAESSITFDANESWLGESGVNLIFTYRVFPEEEKIDIGITRTDGQAIDGIGQIGQLKVTIEDVIFFNNFLPFDFEIGRQKLLNEASISLPSNAMKTTSVIMDRVINQVNESTTSQIVSIFPNPANDQIHFSISGLSSEYSEIRAIDVNGRVVGRWPKLVIEDQVLSVQSWPPGIYFLRFQFSEGVVTKRVVVK